MKKSIALIITIVLISLSYAALSEEAGFVTIQEWLDAKGECGDCMLLLRIQEVLNPVLAIGADETGTVNLYSGGENSLIIEFGNEERLLTGYWMIIGNPRYNEYEGTIEMADWALLRMIPDTQADQHNAESAVKTEEIQALNAQIEQYSAQLAELEAIADERAAQIEMLTAKNTELAAQNQMLSEVVHEQNAKIEMLYEQNADQAAEIEEHRKIIDDQPHIVNPWQKIIDELKVEIDTLAAEKETLLAELISCNAHIEELESKNTALQSRIAELEAMVEKH